jgi:UDP-glucose 4-epimerase
MYLVTGGAGFIGSHVAERLFEDGHRVRVLDNFSEGKRGNLAFARGSDRLEVIEADITDLETTIRAFEGVEVVFHQAAMRSVPRSVDDPLGAARNNITGTLNVLVAAQRMKVRRVVYASSSSAYGDRPDLPKREDQPSVPISPYAVSKLAAEHFCAVWSRIYGVETVSLRYFNVFGPRQDPASQYSAVIPKFIRAALDRRPLEVHGDGKQSRDFTYIDNVVEANLLAAHAPHVAGEVFNAACGDRVSLLEIIRLLEEIVGYPLERFHAPSRPGDVRHTQADIKKAERLLGYVPSVGFEEGLRRTVEYFKEKAGER